MDSILRDIPIPKIFLANTIRNGNTYRVVIDGQQRISAILDFLRDKYSLGKPFEGEHRDKKFSDLDLETQERFLSYQIDFNEAIKPTDAEVREVYARVNKYTVPLTKQELRRADFPGDFLNVSENLAIDDYFDEIGIFTPATRRRYADVEYVSELLAAMIDGIQDKKTQLDTFYIKYANWDATHINEIKTRFVQVLRELRALFPLGEITKTRFKQKSDFYTLFLVIDEFSSEGFSVVSKNTDLLMDDIQLLQHHIRPESDVGICSEYAIKCVSQANSASSRRWRHRFIRPILARTYKGGLPNPEGAQVFYRLMEDMSTGYRKGDCPEPELKCPACGDDIVGDLADYRLAWHESEAVYQIANSQWLHFECISSATNLLVLRRPNHGQTDLF